MPQPSRSQRKALRARAFRAEEHGLPAPQPEAPRRALVQEPRGGSRASGPGAQVAARVGLATSLKVALGAALILVVVFVLSRLR